MMPRRWLAMLSAAAVVGSMFVVPLASASRAAAAAPFSISTNPPLVPAFASNIRNYAVRCSGHSTTQVVTTGSAKVTVAGKSFNGPVDLKLPLKPGQGFEVISADVSYFARCLPSDFPAYSSEVTGSVQAEGYVLTLGTYSAVFDRFGVPVWWDKGVSSPTGGEPNFAEFINPSTIAWGTAAGSFQLLNLNGHVAKTIGGGAVNFDTHDFKVLPNGNYLGFERVNKVVNLSPWGRSSKSTIIDDVIVEINPAGKIVWSWSVASHINVANANVDWRNQFPDVIHMNSLWYDGNGGIIFSVRHLNAVYRVDMATGAITWKLGGTQAGQSLAFTPSTYPTDFSGQHDAQLLPNGDLTLHDDGTLADRPPRALVISLDTADKTATIVSQVTDSRATASGCCGSAIQLPGLDWVISWGENDFMTELGPTGTPLLTITFPGEFSYRAEPDEATVGAMWNGMNVMVAPLHL
jgi:Arylsulfotransferase (ASST)